MYLNTRPVWTMQTNCKWLKFLWVSAETLLVFWGQNVLCRFTSEGDNILRKLNLLEFVRSKFWIIQYVEWKIFGDCISFKRFPHISLPTFPSPTFPPFHLAHCISGSFNLPFSPLLSSCQDSSPCFLSSPHPSWMFSDWKGKKFKVDVKGFLSVYLVEKFLKYTNILRNQL